MREHDTKRLLSSMYVQQARILNEEGHRKAARELMVRALVMRLLPSIAPNPAMIPVRIRRRCAT
jgi:hypothetical protein